MTFIIENPASETPRGRTAKDEVHYGVPVGRFHVGDPIPDPRAPERCAVKVSPDLARHWLTLNHPENRKKKPTKIRQYARDMVEGHWRFTPESLIFSRSGVLQNGQNRLHAVIEAGIPVWFMVDFGWDDGIITTIDRGSARTNSDALAVEGVGNATILAGAYGYWMKYDATVGTPLKWGNRLSPTSSEALEAYSADPDRWAAAVHVGRMVYGSVQGLGPSTWAAAFYAIAVVRGNEKAVAFFDEVVNETGQAGSASRKLKSHYLRRKLADTSSGDPREPFENIVRAFNAWSVGKPVSFIRTGGAFVLTPVRVK